MILRTRTMGAAGHGIGPGGMRCACCGPAPKHRAKVRRTVKRTERAAWKRDVRNGNV